VSLVRTVQRSWGFVPIPPPMWCTAYAGRWAHIPLLDVARVQVAQEGHAEA